MEQPTDPTRRPALDRPITRLALFGAALAVVFGVGLGLGALVADGGDDIPTEPAGVHGGHDEEDAP
jgi:hypothetical protein